MGFLVNLYKMFFVKQPVYEADFLYGCSKEQAYKNVKTLFTTKGYGYKIVKDEANVLVPHVVVTIGTGFVNDLRIVPVNENVSKIQLRVRHDGGNARLSYDTIVKRLHKNFNVKPVDEEKLKAASQPVPVVVAEDYSSLTLKELVEKFNEKLDAFESDVNAGTFAPLEVLRNQLRIAIKKEEGAKKATLNDAFGTIDMYVNTIKSQLGSAAANMINSFVGTYISQMRSALDKMESAL